MKILKFIKNALDVIFNKLDIITYLPELLSPCGHIYVAYAIPRWTRKNYNWGDDINKVLVEKLSGKKVIPYHCSFFPQKHFICIGSVIQWYSNERSIIWGSGMLEPCKPNSPKKILAVRGPLSRKILLENGIPCPAVYGDPALLLPKFYTPIIQKKYDVGVICHIKDDDCSVIKKMRSRPDFHFIDIRKYGKWTGFIDEIVSCRCIITSSLHAVIVSDAYGIPNQWCRFSAYIAEADGFKFNDYFLSVGKEQSLCIDINTLINSNITEYVMSNWQKPIDITNELLKNNPFYYAE